ncbi:unnamed protein product [Rotaria socialis]|uniref:Uncharacterized protein n=1 Tax=Rotaria socialis TaxID=392032 RepID=A0A817QUK8_9BILA|nr:unnamed protein product [Rotaria socialis]
MTKGILDVSNSRMNYDENPNIFVGHIKNSTNLSLSDNPTLKYWDPFINRLKKLKLLQELIINSCGIDQAKTKKQKESNKMFPSLKFLYMSHNKISSFELINELSSTPSVSVLQNSIYPSNQNESETAKQETIARLPNLTH